MVYSPFDKMEIVSKIHGQPSYVTINIIYTDVETETLQYASNFETLPLFVLICVRHALCN